MQLESFTTFNLAILVLALGSWLNGRVKILRDFNIPEPVTSGLLVCLATALLYSFTGLEISFTLATRDFLLLYFFARIGLNSDIKTLRAGGVPLLILVSLTIAYMLLRSADSSGCGLCLVCHLPLHGPQLRGGRHLLRIRRRFFKRNPNRHGKHDGCREETRPSSPRLYHRATRLWFFRGHRECDGYLPISCLAQLKPAPE
jgi:Sodium/glutamate symporter